VRATAGAESPSPSPETKPDTELLVSDTNPGGWALDDLLAQVRMEFQRQLQALRPRAQSNTSSLTNSAMSVIPGAPARLHLLTTTVSCMRVRKD
jgi:hypothetical protein